MNSLPTATYPCWKHISIQAVSKKGRLSNISGFRSIALLYFLSKGLEKIIARRPSSAFINLLSDRHCGLKNEHYAAGLVLINPSWRSLSRFVEVFSLYLDTSKASNSLALLSKPLSYRLRPSLCAFLFSSLLRPICFCYIRRPLF